MNWRFKIVIILLIYLVISCDKKTAEMAKAAPDFELQLLDGSIRKLSDWKGETIYLNFWTVTCKPCLEDFQHHQSTIHEINQQAQTVFLNICLDANAAQIEDYLLRFELNIPNIATVTSIDELVSKYNIGAFPHHALIDAEGKVVKNDDRELFKNLSIKED